MTILFPHGEVSQAEMEMLLRFAIEGRKRVKDQLLRIDSTYEAVQFGYRHRDGRTVMVPTLEEELYPHYYHRGATAVGADEAQAEAAAPPPADEAAELKEKHLVFKENQRGVSYDALFGPYLQGAKRIEVTDPYLRKRHQIRNFMELLETIVRHKAEGEEVEVHLVTIQDEFSENQVESFQRIKQACDTVGIRFTMAFDPLGKPHARHIITDHGWKISLDRGLEIFQYYEMNETFDFTNRLQQQRACKAFEVTFLRVGGG
jgi:ATP-dependent Lon protease